MLSGVCGGIGEYLDIDPTLIRLVWAIFTCVTVGAGLAAYIIAASLSRQITISADKPACLCINNGRSIPHHKQEAASG